MYGQFRKKTELPQNRPLYTDRFSDKKSQDFRIKFLFCGSSRQEDGMEIITHIFIKD